LPITACLLNEYDDDDDDDSIIMHVLGVQRMRCCCSDRLYYHSNVAFQLGTVGPLFTAQLLCRSQSSAYNGNATNVLVSTQMLRALYFIELSDSDVTSRAVDLLWSNVYEVGLL